MRKKYNIGKVIGVFIMLIPIFISYALWLFLAPSGFYESAFFLIITGCIAFFVGIITTIVGLVLITG
jgi:hypothetical protein